MGDLNLLKIPCCTYFKRKNYKWPLYSLIQIIASWDIFKPVLFLDFLSHVFIFIIKKKFKSHLKSCFKEGKEFKKQHKKHLGEKPPKH